MLIWIILFWSKTWIQACLWPEWGQNCGSEKFDESQISSIESDMEKYWLSCPEYSSSNLEFWEYMNPLNGSLPYVYDNFRWAHCDSQGFGFYNYGR